MKKSLIITGALLIIATNLAAGAQVLDQDLSLRYDQPTTQLYRANELSLDAFGGMTLGETTAAPNSGSHNLHDPRFGGGAGINYFFTRNIGIAAEGFSESANHSVIDDASGSLVFRLPFGNSGLAAYIFGGGGRQFDGTRSTSFHTGGGLEYRFTQHFGAFLEPRIMFKQRNYGFGRCGVRWTF